MEALFFNAIEILSSRVRMFSSAKTRSGKAEYNKKNNFSHRSFSIFSVTSRKLFLSSEETPLKIEINNSLNWFLIFDMTVFPFAVREIIIILLSEEEKSPLH